ncbi:unnamed protein product [Sphagnum jensenii]|uniref:Glycoside hydrolase family 79 n=1 Tax=Sphagnum jensenii TaxID=128206 RepID=A0ABP0W0W8_9BRYO
MMYWLNLEATPKWLNLGSTQNVLLTIDGRAPLASIDVAFLCATLDWWPPDKCDYGTCSWGNDSMLNLDLGNPLLEKALVELSPLRLRLGGTLEDLVVYDVGNPPVPCLPFVRAPSSAFGFQGGCLSMARWSALMKFFQRTGTVIAFGLNALYNRKKVASGAWGPWNSSNAYDLIQYTVDQGFEVQAWELGNELSGSGVGTKVSAVQFAADMKELRSVIGVLYDGASVKPLVVAPDGFFDYGWFKQFLTSAGPGGVDVITRHIYNLGPGVSKDLESKILNPNYLNNEKKNFQTVQSLLQAVAPSTVAWVGEAGGAYNSGHHLVTDAFIFSFWYLDQLGMAASYDTKVYCRQSFIGGNYGLLNTTTFEPNPDFYSALLWNRLMGTTVLAASFKGALYLRAYAHCQKNTTQGGVTILLINLSKLITYKVSTVLLTAPSKTSTTRLEYHLTAANGDLHSQVMLLNGNALGVTLDRNIPTLTPVQVDSSTPISVAPLSIVFAQLPDAGVQICSS